MVSVYIYMGICSYILHICGEPIYRQYRGYSYSYLMLTNFIGIAVIIWAIYFAKMLPIQSYIWVVLYCCMRIAVKSVVTIDIIINIII